MCFEKCFEKVEGKFLGFFKPLQKNKILFELATFLSASTIYLAFFFFLFSISSLPNILAGLSVSVLLNLLGFQNAFSMQSLSLSFSTGLQAVIQDLCSGKLEFALLIAFFLSSFDRSVKNRLFGIAFALPLIFIFNVFRISVSIILVLTSSLAVSELFHDVFFRVFLVASIAGVYASWYLWLSNK